MQRNVSGRTGGQPPHQKRDERAHVKDESRDERRLIDVDSIRFGEKIDPRLYSDIAEQAAKTVGAKGRQEKNNKPAQLRRFYDELLMLQEKVGSDKERFEQQRPFIEMLKAKVAYAKGREKVDENFVRLLRKVVDEVRDPETLKQARLFMEAFMAFYKLYGPKD
ncbi:MAG: type III-A CRISPR-associated protein Csm2 [Casimicrobiaceae bacterium]|nr:type III-A CRISPR-associated protein Csm2 [Casimicrobiaceae bacterium]